MKKISNSELLKIVTKILILLVVAKFISFSLWLYLPTESIELYTKKNIIQEYKRINFSNMIRTKKVEVKKVEVKKVEVKDEVTMTNMILKGLYGNEISGYIIVAMKNKIKKTSIVEVGEIYQGYKLKTILKDKVIFTKNGKNYILEVKEVKTSKYIRSASGLPAPPSLNSAKSKPIRSNAVSRNDIKHYIKNPSQIWRDISIGEVKKNNKITGFKVNRIKAGSRFALLGLKQGDLIIKANNVKLDSYRSAMSIYKNINNLDAIEIIVLRNNQEVELVYEIN